MAVAALSSQVVLGRRVDADLRGGTSLIPRSDLDRVIRSAKLNEDRCDAAVRAASSERAPRQATGNKSCTGVIGWFLNAHSFAERFGYQAVCADRQARPAASSDFPPRLSCALSPYKRYFEAGPIDQLREFVPGGSLVIDVGANVGFFTLRFAEWVGDSGKVIAIEPEDQNYSGLISAIEHAGFLGRVEALRAVAAAEPGTTFLEINPLYPADHKLSRNGTGVPVTAVTLDGLLADKGPRRPALVKIDVQGAELLTLQGMIEILRFARPALFVELSDQGLNKFGAVLVVLRLLSDNGYEGYLLTRTGRRKASQSEIEARTTGTKSADVLFLPDRPANSASHSALN
ncbi:FkbM family methyltransferase [Mesorhizobium sp. B2-8-3]|uniref:FkbM family methyltransferase n=1 Tax=Mesorhizobium sp. B2-8-3 TaxID=2589905 RepID=UPI0015E43F5B|nr:FkbM family methyltransferase [Mesorhizobium sp. B2-8-3]